MLGKFKEAVTKKFHFEALESEPEEREYTIPEGQFRVSDFARGSGMSRYKAGQLLRKLVEGGVIEQLPSETGRTTVYQIIGGGPNPSKVTREPMTGGSSKDDIDFVKISDELIFKFIRATRSTDVLLYLTWLEKEGRSDE